MSISTDKHCQNRQPADRGFCPDLYWLHITDIPQFGLHAEAYWRCLCCKVRYDGQGAGMLKLEVADNLPRLLVTSVGSGYALFLHRRSEQQSIAFLRGAHGGWRCGGR